MYKVMIYGETGPSFLDKFPTREEAQKEADDWNRRHGYSVQSIIKYGNTGSAYVTK